MTNDQTTPDYRTLLIGLLIWGVGQGGLLWVFD